MNTQHSYFVLNSYPSFSLDTHPSIFSIHAEYPGLEEIEVEPDKDDWFHKNTESFKCFAQVMVSRSSLIFHPLYYFPPLEDPGIDAAFNYEEPKPVYDDIGCTKYLDMCKEFAIVPISRICKYLPTKVLNLKFYGLTVQQIKAITEALRLNVYVEELDLQDNWLPLESTAALAGMLENNNTIQVLNLRECRIGPEGANLLCEAITASQKLMDLDLSYNSLGDEGLIALTPGLKLNTSLKKLNLNNNNFTEKSGDSIERILRENKTIEDLDLSWNGFYTADGNKKLFNGLLRNDVIKKLNLAWNGISDPKAIRPLGKALVYATALEELDLSWNRLAEDGLRAARIALNKSKSLKIIRLGHNKITPDEGLTLSRLLIRKPQLEILDLEDVWFTKLVLPTLNKIKKMDKTLIYGGVYSNFKIIGPDELKLLFDRCRYLLMKAKKKKLKKDFGQFILKLPDKNVGRPEIEALIVKEKMKKILLDKDLMNAVFKKFPAKYNLYDTVKMKEDYLSYFPDTKLPPPKPKKEKKGKKGKAKGKGKKGKKGEQSGEPEPGLKPEKTIEEGILEYLTGQKEDLTVSELNLLAVLEDEADGEGAFDQEDEVDGAEMESEYDFDEEFDEEEGEEEYDEEEEEEYDFEEQEIEDVFYND